MRELLNDIAKGILSLCSVLALFVGVIVALHVSIGIYGVTVNYLNPEACERWLLETPPPGYRGRPYFEPGDRWGKARQCAFEQLD